MAATIDVAQPLNVADPARPNDAPTPTTPRPTFVFPQPATDNNATTTNNNNESGSRTPKRQHLHEDSDRSSVPAEPVTPAQQRDKSTEPTNVSRSEGSAAPQTPGQSQDVDMADADAEEGAAGEEDGSDNESATSESQRSSKKKKGQRFFCTEFPPCQLSFTRSEHLARHIRKHTGERPFQCHCGRRFSRLDNLRQHAQTVHMGEEIPDGSLAATSTRFQRQIRTDRVRPPSSRSRASTIGSNGGHSRGHSRNVSTSSIGSTSSSVCGLEESRKRPLAMAIESPSRPRLETYSHLPGPPPQYGYYNHSPTGYSTPTSTIYSTEVGSPRFGSSMASPISAMSRSSFYDGGPTGHGRRLSVPSASHPFQSSSLGSTYPPPFFGAPMQVPPGFSPQGSMFGSPTSSVYSHSRRESESELEWRRRTWHPSTNSNYSQRPATSGLSYHQTPDDKQPAASEQPAASQKPRLPGIESFDKAARQHPSPMMVDATPRPTSSGRVLEVPPPPPPGHPHAMTRLDVGAANAPFEGQWQGAPHTQAGQPQQIYYQQQQPPTMAPQNMQQQQQRPLQPPMPEPTTPRRNKRQAWYGGPVGGPAPAPGQQQPQQPHQQQHPAYSSHRPSPEDSGSSDGVPTPSTSLVNESHPVIVNPGMVIPEPAGCYSGGASGEEHGGQPKTYPMQTGHDPAFASAAAAGAGYPHPHVHHPPPQPHHHVHHHAIAPHSQDMSPLDALVAVASREQRAVERS